MITHRHAFVMVDMIRRVEGLFTGSDRVLLYLPLAHTFARLVQYAGAGAGFTVAFCPDIDLVAQALLDVKPTILPSVPRLFEKVQAGVQAAFDEATGARRRLVDWSLAVGQEAAALRREGSRLPSTLAVKHAAADRLVFSKVRSKLGGELRVAISGGAPLAVEVAEFFHSLGILILEGYGLTECTTASHVNRPGRFRFGTVGFPLDGVECRTADDGEVLLRGDNVFAGYHGDERATRAVLHGRRLADDGRRRLDRRGRLPHDHRSQERAHRHSRREERLAAEHRERAQGIADRLAGPCRGRRTALRRRPDRSRS